jgi:hypothetical protein
MAEQSGPTKDSVIAQLNKLVADNKPLKGFATHYNPFLFEKRVVALIDEIKKAEKLTTELVTAANSFKIPVAPKATK